MATPLSAAAPRMTPLARSAPAPKDATKKDTTDLDFSTIDTEQKAALLPSLTQNIMDDAAISMSLAGITDPQGPHFNVNSELSEYIGSADSGAIPVNMTYSMPYGSSTMQASGSIGKTPVTETWTIDKDMNVTISGTVGTSKEDLRLSYDKKTNTRRLDGKVGSIEVHKSCIATETPNFWDGTVGNLASHDMEKFDVDASGAISANHTTGRMTAMGSGSFPASSLSTQIDTNLIDTPSKMSEAGKGIVADVPVTYLFESHYQENA